jgi:hypothetical protein
MVVGTQRRVARWERVKISTRWGRLKNRAVSRRALRAIRIRTVKKWITRLHCVEFARRETRCSPMPRDNILVIRYDRAPTGHQRQACGSNSFSSRFELPRRFCDHGLKDNSTRFFRRPQQTPVATESPCKLLRSAAANESPTHSP